MTYYAVTVVMQVKAENEAEACNTIFDALDPDYGEETPSWMQGTGIASFAVRAAERVGAQPQFILGKERG